MNVTDPIRRVSVVSTGQVQIRPDHLASTWRPAAWWLLASRRWTGPRPINAYVIEHRDGLVLFDTGQDRASVTDPGYFPGGITGMLYGRLARFEISPDETLTAGLDRLGYAAGDVKTAVLSHLHQDHIGGLAELEPRRHRGQPGRVGHAVQPAAADARADAPPHRPARPALAPDQAELTGDPGLAPFRAGHDLFGDGSLVLLPTPGHTPGSMSLLVRRPGLPPLMMVGDVTYDADLLEAGHVPGVGSRRRLREATAMINTLRQRESGPGDPARSRPGSGEPPGPGHRPGSKGGDRVAMLAIDTLEAIQAGGTTQWIRVRGADASNPVLLLIQQGPGLPMINEARRFEHLLGPGTSLHRRLLGPARLRPLAATDARTGPASAWRRW